MGSCLLVSAGLPSRRGLALGKRCLLRCVDRLSVNVVCHPKTFAISTSGMASFPAPTMTSETVGSTSSTNAFSSPSLYVGVSWFKRMQVYVSGQNLYTITDYTGYDPEISTFGGSNSFSVGIDQTGYPTAKTYTFGLNVGF